MFLDLNFLNYKKETKLIEEQDDVPLGDCVN